MKIKTIILTVIILATLGNARAIKCKSFEEYCVFEKERIYSTDYYIINNSRKTFIADCRIKHKREKFKLNSYGYKKIYSSESIRDKVTDTIINTRAYVRCNFEEYKK